MDRGEPTLAPEWLKASGPSSSHSDEHNNSGTLSRNRLAASACDHDTPRVLSSSFRRSASSNASIGNDKDGYARSRDYSSFSRSRDRDRDRQRYRDKDKLLDNGYNEFCDALMARRMEKDTLRRSQSMVSGRRVETLPKRLGSGSSNGVLSVGGSSGGLSKVSFERDFPSLGAEEKHGVSEIVRVPSPGIGTAINNLHISTSAIIGADGWTSALAEVPAVGVGNGSSMSSAIQSTANTSSTSLSTTTGLSMAETLAQAPSRARTAPLLSHESERRKELTLMQQYNKLIPVTPQAPKNLVLNTSDKLKPKGARNGDLVAPKVGLQPSSQVVKTTTSQAGNFLVLNRENIGASSPTAAKDGPPPPLTTTASRVQSASGPHMKLKANNGMMGAKKPLITTQAANQKLKANGGMAQDRNDFFNSLRKKAEMKNGVSHHHPELSCCGASSSAPSISNSTRKSDEQTVEKNILASSNSGLSECAVTENGDPDVAVVAPDEKEKAFLESLGWNENYAGDEEALTAEEIESFLKKHEAKLGPDFKYKAGLSGSYSSGLSLSSS